MFDWISEFQTWLFDVLLWVPRQVFKYAVDGLLSVFNSLTPPDFIANVAAASAAIPGSVWYFASVLNLDIGLGIIVSAYGLRFLIRRIPIIG